MSRQLPPDPSFRFVQKEAKDLLKAHHRGDTSACAVLRRHPRFVNSDDAEILASDVSLQEMQHALALHYDFKNWSDLAATIDSMRRARATPSTLKKCDLCNRGATVHVTDVTDGVVHAAHYCDAHKPANVPVTPGIPTPDLTISISAVISSGGATEAFLPKSM